MVESLAAEQGRLRISALKAVQIKSCYQSLVKVETDAGIVGYGEAGGPGPMIRGNLRYFETYLLGKDPLEIDRLFNLMINLQHPNRPHIPTVSGIDIALWDIAGKVLNRPVSRLLRGQYRTEVPIYINTGGPADWFDKGACKAWAAEIEAHPFGLKAVKMDFKRLLGNPLPRDLMHVGHRTTMLRVSDIKLIGQAYENLRAALDPKIDMIVHCHNEFDLPSAIGLAKAVAPIQPLWIEDALPVLYNDTWKRFRDASPVPVLTGEKLELTREFEPFLINQAVDMLQPDILFAGGLTGSWQIADMADRHYVPVTAHNIGTVVQNAVTAHFAASARNFVMTETRLGSGHTLDDLIEEKLEVADGKLAVPTGPGLGITLVEEAVRANMAPREPYWD